MLIIPFVWLEAYRLQGVWRWIYRLFWIIPFTYACLHVPIDRFLLFFYHMVFKNSAEITIWGITGFEWSGFIWKHSADSEIILILMSFAFFGLSLVAMFWPVRWPKNIRHAATVAKPQPDDEGPLAQSTDSTIEPIFADTQANLPISG
jgi:hypothetical protein